MSGLSQDNIEMRLREAVITARHAEVMRKSRLNIIFFFAPYFNTVFS